MDVMIKHIKPKDEENVILINLYNNEQEICDNKIKVDTEKKRIYNYKEFFTEIIEKSFMNNIAYKISIDNEERMDSDIEGLPSLLKQSIAVYNKIVQEDIEQ